MKHLLFLLCCLLALTTQAAPKKQSPIISAGPGGTLKYDADENGDRVLDFSTCGYAGADRPIPNVPVKVVIAPENGDETAAIQRALDYVGTLPSDDTGCRGKVLLLKGVHHVAGQLLITNSGVVIGGQGLTPDDTILLATGTDRRTLIRLALSARPVPAQTAPASTHHAITDDRVPVGTLSFHLADASSFKVGDAINLTRPSTKEWIDFLGMTEFGGGIGDWRLVWKPGTRDLIWHRTIISISNDLVTVDSPIATALDKKFGGGYVTPDTATRIHNVGVENLRLVSAYDTANPKDENHSWFAITMDDTADAWVRQVAFEHFVGSAVAIYETCQRVTVEDCISLAPVSENAGWRRNTFYTMGQQTLFLRCYSEYGRHDFGVGFCAAGPNAFVQCESTLPQADSGAIESWSSGTLFDNVRIDGGGLSLINRGSDSEGAGWSAANSVLWQCNCSQISCENPPGARNFAFGCWGEFEGNGVWRDANASVHPVSLYIAQLAQRHGADPGIKLMNRSLEEYSNPTPEQAARLIAASRQPAPQLSDYILASGRRDPIPSEPGDAQRVEDLPARAADGATVMHTISVTNGWLVCDGKLLTGSTMAINWWRGNMHPSEAPGYGVNLSRFAPGRAGAGLTDDLNDIADAMQDEHAAAFDHHYGLWYDRRREDHERVRRVDGAVWAPFYEQPFARSGTGTAWDGLSQYDLTKFNLWYWSRLQAFADLCDQRGLVLFNENYFQHNILEAGAHWVDCPWRSANNINSTGFPEPPPFAGDKRIFMAEQFYDVTNPTRRALHRGFIRQNLDNFTNEPNVIQFTSAEFTGPVAFEQFWLDTIAEWKSDTGHKPIIALACPKNVQDAILADPKRNAVVDVICFRYWWRTDRGEFAPDGGQNLSPRQFERKGKSGTPSDENLASMATEYKQKYPDKAVIASGEDESLGRTGWAFVLAGGSMPNLSTSTDANLLAAIPHMHPEVTASGQCYLREPGKQLLFQVRGSAPIDLSSEKGAFHVQTVDRGSGRVTAQSGTITASTSVTLPQGLVWLTAAN